MLKDSEKIEHIKIRKAKMTDIPTIMRIEKESFSDPWSEGAFLSSLDRTFVAELEGEVVGYIVTSKFGNEVNIDNIAVRKDLRRKGVGSIMMKFIIENNPNCTFFLEVRPSNIQAICFYKKFGFKEFYRRKRYYQNEDAIVMIRTFSEGENTKG